MYIRRKIRFYKFLFVIVVMLAAVAIINQKVIWVITNKTLTDLNASRQVNTSINCFKDLKEGLPDLSIIQPDWRRSLYFLEVSCRSSTNGRISILPRQACAIESAAFTNPNFDVHVLYASLGMIKNQGSLSDYLLEILLSYKNIKFFHFDIMSLVNGSIIESLYQQNKVQSAAYPMIVTSDILRLLILQKYGGVYLDLDVIVLKELDTLPLNFVGLQSDTVVNNAVMRISNDGIGKLFTKLCLEDLKENFNGTEWQLTGPIVVTKVMKEMCDVNDVSVMPTIDCLSFNVLPVETFYPIKWQDWLKYFEEERSKDLYNHILKNSYTVHVWNKFSSSLVASDAPSSIYNTLAQKFCPYVYKAASKYF